MKNSELERAAYMTGNIAVASVYDQLDIFEDDDTIDQIDNALDMLGLSGLRGDRLLSALEHIGRQHAAYKEALIEIRDINRLPKDAKNVISDLDLE